MTYWECERLTHDLLIDNLNIKTWNVKCPICKIPARFVHG